MVLAVGCRFISYDSMKCEREEASGTDVCWCLDATKGAFGSGRVWVGGP